MAKTQTITWFHTPSFVLAGRVIAKLSQEGFEVQARPCADVTQINIINAPAEDAPNIFLAAVYESKDFGKGLDPIETFMAETAQSLYSNLTAGGDTFMERVMLLQKACVPGTYPVKTTVEEIQEVEGGEVSLEDLNDLMLRMAFEEPSTDSMQTLVDTMRRCKNPLAQHQLPEFEKLLAERKTIDALEEEFLKVREGTHALEEEFLKVREGTHDLKRILAPLGLLGDLEASLDKLAQGAESVQNANQDAELNGELVETTDGKYISLKELKAFCAGHVQGDTGYGFDKECFEASLDAAIRTVRGEEVGAHPRISKFSHNVRTYFLK